MAERPSFEEENIIKYVKIFLDWRNKKKTIGTTIKDIKNLFKPEKDSNAIENKIIRDTRHLLEHKEESYYKPLRVSNFWSNNYIEYESRRDGNKILPVKEYLNKIRPYLKDIINNLKKSDTWKIRLTIANRFISSTDNDEERVMYSKWQHRNND